MTLVWGQALVSGGATATAELGETTVDQCTLTDGRFTLIAPDEYADALLEVRLYSAGRRGARARVALRRRRRRRRPALVVQWTRRPPPKRQIQVRLLAGALPGWVAAGCMHPAGDRCMHRSRDRRMRRSPTTAGAAPGRRRRSCSARRRGRRAAASIASRPPLWRSSTLITPQIVRPSSASAAIAASVEPPVVTTSSTTTQRSRCVEQRPLDPAREAVRLDVLAHEEGLAVEAAGERGAGDRVGPHRHPADRGRPPLAALRRDQLAERGEAVREQDRALGVDVVGGAWRRS